MDEVEWDSIFRTKWSTIPENATWQDVGKSKTEKENVELDIFDTL